MQTTPVSGKLIAESTRKDEATLACNQPLTSQDMTFWLTPGQEWGYGDTESPCSELYAVMSNLAERVAFHA